MSTVWAYDSGEERVSRDNSLKPNYLLKIFFMKKIIILLFLILQLLFLWCSEEEETSINNWNISDNLSEKIETKYILAIWDSLTAGYGLDIEDSYPSQLEDLLASEWYDYKVINSGVSGETTAWLLGRIDWTIADLGDVELAILVSGGNDWLRWLSTEEMRTNLEMIIQKLKEKNIDIIFWGMQILPNLGKNYTEKFSGVYTDISSNDDEIYFLPFFLEWVAGDPVLNISDGIHPNKEWYQIIVNNLFDFLVENDLIDK